MFSVHSMPPILVETQRTVLFALCIMVQPVKPDLPSEGIRSVPSNTIPRPMSKFCARVHKGHQGKLFLSQLPVWLDARVVCCYKHKKKKHANTYKLSEWCFPPIIY